MSLYYKGFAKGSHEKEKEMKLNFQKMILGGTLGKDVEIRDFPNGGKVANLTVATEENWKDKNTSEWKSKTTWHNVKLFGKAVDYIATKAVKGAPVLVEGIINTDSYEKDGVKKSFTFIKADKVNVLATKQDGMQGKLQSEQAGLTADSIPF